ncbi:MAG: hypothetical protein EA425_17990 [Puniceicoccaceae bacterium]|nr:MAG: hypothetical protein EA425_17990 [Puniceicoccaceae bacterium]
MTRDPESPAQAGSASHRPVWQGYLLFLLALAAFPAWGGTMWWLANHRSGWNDLVDHFGPAPAHLTYDHQRAVVGVIRPPNRRHVFADSDGGGYRRGRVDYGYDEEGFWMRGRYRGLTYGPTRPLHVPWSEVRDHAQLTIRFHNHPYRLYVQEQALLDAVDRYAGR